MKPIKIVPANQAAIVAALLEANGRADSHTYTTYDEIDTLAEVAETKLDSLSIAKARRAGAVWVETSGSTVSSSYARLGRSRVATTVRLERRSSDWYLVDVRKAEIYQRGGGKGSLVLTQAQADEALAVTRSLFSIHVEAA